jgi:phage tail sheath gpL-like
MTQGLSDTNFLPGITMGITYAAGQTSGVAGPQSVLLMGAALSSSFAVSNSFYDGYVWGPSAPAPFTVQSEQDVINAFGTGSDLHRAFRTCQLHNQGASPISFVAVKESTGSAATGSIVFTNTATANGTVAVFIADTQINSEITNGDTPTVIAANCAAAIAAQVNLPVTASASTGTITLTAKQKGPAGNQIRFAARISGSGVATTSSASNFAYLSGGTTSQNFTNALATIDPLQFSYIATSADNATSSTSLGGVVDQIEANYQPLVGIRQRLMVGFTGTEGSAVTLASEINVPMVDVGWDQNSNYTPFEIAAALAGTYAAAESSSVPQLNFDNLGALPSNASQWLLSAPFDGTTQSNSTLVAALMGGVSPICSQGNGKSQLVSAVTSYFLSTVGSGPPSAGGSGVYDFRTRDHSVVTVMQLLANLVISALGASFANKLIGDDPPPGAKPPTSGVVTPSDVVAVVNKVISRMYANGLLDDLSDALAATTCVRDSGNPSRFDIQVAVTPISPAHQFNVSMNQLSP